VNSGDDDDLAMTTMNVMPMLMPPGRSGALLHPDDAGLPDNDNGDSDSDDNHKRDDRDDTVDDDDSNDYNECYDAGADDYADNERDADATMTIMNAMKMRMMATMMFMAMKTMIMNADADAPWAVRCFISSR